MNNLRFPLFGGALWAGVTLLLILFSLAGGDSSSWVELDFRPLTGAVLLLADMVGLGFHFETVTRYAETGMPISPINVIISLVIGFADGFLSGWLISLIYNFIQKGEHAPGINPFGFGLSFGIVFGLCSGLLCLVVISYDINIKSFDFSVKPLFLIFTNFEEAFRNTFLYKARESYLIFPSSFIGVLLWMFWGFLDGLAAGAAGAYIYNKILSLKS